MGYAFSFTIVPMPFTYSQYLFLGVLFGVLGVIGDLLESYLKRSFMVKDTNDLLPGWGGLLDRVDGLLINFPIVYYYIKYFC